jgi:NADPH:quinone reductase
MAASTPNLDPLPSTMRAVVLHDAKGGLDALRIEERAVPKAGPGEVLVKIAASPVNPSDLMFTKGMYGITKPVPVVPGFEGSGRVVGAGGGFAAQALVGLRVAVSASIDGDGTWAEYARVPVQQCIPLLPWVGDDEAASAIVNPLTAHALVQLARKQGHEGVVQTAGASALGRMLVRLCKREGLPLVSVVRREEQARALRDLGATHVVDSSTEGWRETLRHMARDVKASVAFEAVAGKLTGEIAAAMPHGSTIVVYGGLSETPCSVDPRELIFRGIHVQGFWLADWFRTAGLPAVLEGGVAVQRRIRQEFATTIRDKVGFDRFLSSTRDYEARMSEGKILLCPSFPA